MNQIRRAEPSPMRSTVSRGCVVLRAGAVTAAVVWSQACGAPMEIFSTASDAAERVTSLAWFMIIASAVVFTGVMLTIMVAVRRNRERDSAIDLTPRSNGWIIYGGALMPTLVLATIFVVSLSAMGRSRRDRP